MDTDWEALIIRYHRNQLSDAERLELEHLRADDPLFDQAITDYGLAWEAVRLEANTRLRERLAQKGKELDAHRAQKKQRRIWGALLLLFVPVVLLILWLTKEPSPAAPAVTPERPASDSAATQAPPAMPVPPPARETGKKPAPAPRQIFAEFFQPHIDESLEYAVRGDSPPTPEEQFLHDYWKGDYKKALVAFDALEPFSQASENNRFLYANCLLEARRSKAALSVLEGMRDNQPARYREHVPWYYALCLLAENRTTGAEAILQPLAADSTSMYREKASQLLSRLE